MKVTDRIFSKLVCIAVALSSMALGRAQLLNLVQNGGFDINADFWTPSGGVDASGGYSGAGNPPGSFILNAGGQVDSDPTISQVIHGLAPGSSYLISGDYASFYASFGNPAALSFGVAVNDQILLELARPAGGEQAWAHFSVEFAAPAESITLALSGERNGDDSSYGVDNISLTSVAVPEPQACLAVFGGALLLLGLVRRRRASGARQPS